MSIASNALCTLEDFKKFIGVDLGDTSKDEIYLTYINGVSQQIENIIGRKILAADYVEKYKGANSTDLILKHYPINSITKVSYVEDCTEVEALDSYDYDVDEETGILNKANGWLLRGYSTYMSGRVDFPRKYIKVEYNAGFTEVPYDLKLVCMQLCADTYTFDNSDANKFQQYKIDDVQITYRDNANFSDEQLKIIRSYRQVHI